MVNGLGTEHDFRVTEVRDYPRPGSTILASLGNFVAGNQRTTTRSQIMATALQGVRSTARSCLCSQTPFRYATNSIGTGRAFSTTFPRSKRTNRVKTGLTKARKSGSPQAAALLETDKEIDAVRAAGSKGDEWDAVKQKLDSKHRPWELATQRRRKLKETFMNMGEAEPWEDEYTMEDDDDDINSLAHGELEQHREMRHYARLVAWEMPLLSSMLCSCFGHHSSLLGLLLMI